MVELRLAVGAEFIYARGLAVQSYTDVEFSLSLMLTHLLRVEPDTAGTLFYRIVNSRSRNAIFNDLFKKRYGDQYKEYWNSLMKMIQALDQRRNEIIHWKMVHNVHVWNKASTKRGNALMPPNFWAHGENTPVLSLADLTDFIDRCDVVSRALIMLKTHLDGPAPETMPSTWREILQRPLDYPLPAGHPLRRTDTEQPGPPESSQE